MMLNFPNGSPNSIGMPIGGVGMGMMNPGMMSPTSPMMSSGMPATGQVFGSVAPLEAYTCTKKDDTAIKVATIGTFAIVVGALLTKGKGLKSITGAFKSSKNIDKGVEATQKQGFFSRLFKKKAAKVPAQEATVTPPVQVSPAQYPVMLDAEAAAKAKLAQSTKGMVDSALKNPNFDNLAKTANEEIKVAEKAVIPEPTGLSFYDKPKTKGKIKEDHEWQYSAEKLRLEKQAAASEKAVIPEPTGLSFYDKPKTKGKIKEDHQWQYSAEKIKLEKQAAANAKAEAPAQTESDKIKYSAGVAHPSTKGTKKNPLKAKDIQKVLKEQTKANK